MKCTHCNADIPDDSVFCPSCGQKAESQSQPEKKCRKCLAPLKADAKFCEFCGATADEAGKTCPACSTKVTGGAAFCPNCGYRMGEQPSGQTAWQAPVQAAVPQQPVYPAQPHVQPYTQPYGQAATPYPAYSQAPTTARPPRKKKGWLIAVIIIVVLAVAGGVTALVAGKQIKRLLMGPKATYLAIEGVALKQQTDDMLTELVKYGNTGTRDPKGGMDLELKVSLEAEKLGIDPV
ncbi:MAG: zinc ribbon domain-containing protein, partial [Bacillota bacterium]|nr:zinc ribbon domain-containing protein [Bacillota bacterium]